MSTAAAPHTLRLQVWAPACQKLQCLPPDLSSLVILISSLNALRCTQANLEYLQPDSRNMASSLSSWPTSMQNPDIHPLRCTQVNLEYLQLDSRSFVTGEDRALSLLFGASSDESVEARVTVKRIAQRLATLFATLKVTGRGI